MKKLSLICLLVTMSIGTFAQKAKATKMVLLEQSCWKLCGPCLTHQYEEIDPLYKNNYDKIAMVIYSQAPIGIGKIGELNKPCELFYSEFNIEYQSSVIVDRTYFPGNWSEEVESEAVNSVTTAFETQINSDYVPVEVGIQNTYNASNRKVDITLTANFVDTASGDLRFYLVLVQDTIVGGNDLQPYAQNANASAGTTLYGYPVISYGTGSSWIAKYPFKNAVKHQPSGFYGTAGKIPTNPVIGTTYTENYSFTLPLKNSTSEVVNIDPDRIKIIAAVVKKGTFLNRQVLNTNKKYLTATSSTNELSSIPNFDFSVNNPIDNFMHLNYSAEKEGLGEFTIYNAIGDAVKTIPNIEYGKSSSTKSVDVSDLNNGIYFVSLKAEGKYLTKKVIISK